MTNLTTRKIVLGLLLTFVLALGVQSTADALDVTRSAIGSNNNDLGYRFPGQTFKISFYVSDVAAATDDLDIPAAPAGATLTHIRGIDVSDEGLTDNVSLEGNWYELNRNRDSDNNLDTSDDIPSYRQLINNRSYALTYEVNGTASADISITINTDVVYTIYVVALAASNPTSVFTDITAPVFRGFKDNLNPFSVDETAFANDSTATGDSSEVISFETAIDRIPVTYRASGKGKFYVKTGGRETSRANPFTTSSEAPVWLDMNSDSNTVTVQAHVKGIPASQAKSESVVVIYYYGEIKPVSGHSPKQVGAPSGRLDDPFVIQLVDASGGVVADQNVIFTATGANNVAVSADPITVNLADTANDRFVPGTAVSEVSGGYESATVKTDSQGKASVFLVLGNAAAEYGVTVALVSGTTLYTFNATAGEQREASSISIVSGDGQRADQHGDLEDPLVVVVRDKRSRRLANSIVTFVALDGGEVEFPESDEPGMQRPDGNTDGQPDEGNNTVTAKDMVTDTSGEASIRYAPPEAGGRRTVRASINSGLQSVVFTINGPPSSGGGGGDDSGGDDRTSTRGSLNITVSPDTGTTRTVTVTASRDGSTVPGIGVQLNVNNGATLSRESGVTPLTSTLTLPTTAGNYILTATTTHPDYTGDTETIVVTLPGTLSLEELGARAANGGQSIRVTVREANGTLASGDVLVTLSGAVSRTVPTRNGTGTASITLLTTGGTVTLTATGYNDGSYTFGATSQQQQPPATGQQPPTTGPAGVADRIGIDGSRQLSSTVNRNTPLRVRVTDTGGNGVSDVRVTFRVLAPGRGRLSQRGNGRAVVIQTDRNGYANATLTPLGDGNLIVEAKAAGITAPVSFIVNVGEADATPTSTPGTDVTTSREINPVVNVGAAHRSPILWVDGGKIYALVGADVQEFGSGVAGAMNIAVGGGKVYWTEQTGESAGTINSANLDGSDAKELKSLLAVPMGIAIDVANSKLYWTNSRGRIQRLNADGSDRIENVLQDLPGPMDIAITRGNLYWTQYDATEGVGSIGITNTAGRGTPKYISTGSDMPGSLTISGKVYWTEMTGTSAGTINSANLNGSGAKELKSIRAVPMGIAVDGSRSKLYWTNSRGRIQSANLDGSKISSVVDGLGSPGDMVLSNSISAPAATTTKTPTTTKTASNKYDVNGDGSVDSTDVDVLLLAVLAELTDDKYDVNGDGKVDVSDVKAVNGNLDAGAAGAPTLLGTKFSALEVDALQEQIDLLIATNDRSPAAMRTLIYLQQLIVMARPEKTQLLANYPNPFNPETWIPYELATDTDVRITIYNAQGVVIRTLQLGQQSAGYYTGRERAAYWDGRNALGEQVASGVYFYQFETDEMSSMRKMVILK